VSGSETRSSDRQAGQTHGMASKSIIPTARWVEASVGASARRGSGLAPAAAGEAPPIRQRRLHVTKVVVIVMHAATTSFAIENIQCDWRCTGFRGELHSPIVTPAVRGVRAFHGSS
jgi:hypothetical protein